MREREREEVCFGFHFASACPPPCLSCGRFGKQPSGMPLFVHLPRGALPAALPVLSRFEWTLPLFRQQEELIFHLYFIFPFLFLLSDCLIPWAKYFNF